MKKLLSILTVFTLLFIGCSNDVNINNPTDNLEGWEVVTRSVPEGLQVNTVYTVSKVINGSTGGYLFTGNIEQTKNGTTGCVYGLLSFPAGAFSGTKTITMSLDNKKLNGTFGPSMTFSRPASFSVLFAGVNLLNTQQSDYKFVYWDPSGNSYEIPYTFLYFDKVKGVLGILNAQLPHFSRYVFVRKSA
jgi:hypothetical protein